MLINLKVSVKLSYLRTQTGIKKKFHYLHNETFIVLLINCNLPE